jgi:hypothetical protein
VADRLSAAVSFEANYEPTIEDARTFQSRMFNGSDIFRGATVAGWPDGRSSTGCVSPC